MLGPPRRQQDPDQRQNDVDCQVGKRLVRPGGNVERERDDKDNARQSEDGPAQLHPTPLTCTRDGDASRHSLHHLGLAVCLISRA